ncbi:hypothetical protein [Ornithinibacillus contaminans]|uniref:hypothetical protein n=1 Tax=Ornithinibacillus contaminans TaxID=694055 RepID=UPI00064E0EE8|nr:hypothetical protein [Ornithinibacillus contaminans]
MKKILFTLLCATGFVLFYGTITFASESELDSTSSKKEVSIQAGVEAYLSPSKLSTSHLTWETIRVGTNVGGVSTFYFNPGDGSSIKSGNAVSRRDFSHRWSVRTLTTFTTSGRAISEEYGPSPWFYGTATVTY